MNDNIARARTIKWIEAQRAELESEISELNRKLAIKKREYEDFEALLIKLQKEDSLTSINIEQNCSNSSQPDRQTEVKRHRSPDCLFEAHPEISAVENENNYKFSFYEIESDIEDDIDDYENESDDFEGNEESNCSPKHWLRPEYQNRPMEDVVFEILEQIQPAKPGDVALKIYQIGQDDLNFDRAKNSVNATLTNGKKAKKWRTLRRGVYVLNDYPASFKSKVGQNGHHKTYQTV